MASRTDTFWRKFQERSVFKWTLTEEVLDSLLKNSSIDDLVTVLGRIFSGIGQSGVIEDSFQRMRRQEKLNEGGTKMSGNRCWKIASDSKLLQETYDYNEVQGSQIPEKHNTSVPPGFFSPSCANTSVPMSDVASTSSTAHWSSVQPPFLQYSEDIGLLQFMHNIPEKATQIWRTAFMPSNQIVRNKKIDPNRRFLSFGSSSYNHCALLWPVVESPLVLKKRTVTLWTLKTLSGPSELKWMPVLDFGEWLITPSTVWSPLHIFAENKGELPGRFALNHLIQAAAEVPLLRFCAQNAFWGVSLQLLKKLCKDRIMGFGSVTAQFHLTLVFCSAFFLDENFFGTDDKPNSFVSIHPAGISV